jgi:hypothetical protein
MDEAREKNKGVMFSEGVQIVRKFIDTDAKRLGEKQAAGTLRKAGAKRLAALQTAGFA